MIGLPTTYLITNILKNNSNKFSGFFNKNTSTNNLNINNPFVNKTV